MKVTFKQKDVKEKVPTWGDYFVEDGTCSVFLFVKASTSNPSGVCNLIELSSGRPYFPNPMSFGELSVSVEQEIREGVLRPINGEIVVIEQ